MGTLLNRRRYMGGVKGLPYDAEIEYLQYDGYEYIDTLIKPDQTIECELSFMPTSDRAESTGLFSCRNATTQASYPNSYSLSVWVNGNKIAFNDRDYDSGWVSNVISYNSIYKVEIKNRSIYVNNSLIKQSGKSSTFSFNTTYGLLRDHRMNDYWDNRRGSSGKLYYCKIWKGGSLVREYIPVRVGQVGYMYDKVSGRLFGNVGTGSFALGNDKTT